MVEPYHTWKVEWINGPDNQTTFDVSLSLNTDRESVVNLAGLGDATFAEQQAQTAELQDINAELNAQTAHLATIAVDVSDVATETTLSVASGRLQSINTTLTNIDGKAATQIGHLSQIETAVEASQGVLVGIGTVQSTHTPLLEEIDAFAEQTVDGLTALSALVSLSTHADDGGFPAGGRVAASGHILDEVAGGALTENDVAVSRIDPKRAQVMVLEDATTRGQRQAVSVAGAALVDTELPAPAALADDMATPTTPLIGACCMGYDASGNNFDRLRAYNGFLAIQGRDAHDAVSLATPVLVGFYASATAPAAVSADRDLVRPWATLNGSPVCNLAAGSALIGGTTAGLFAQGADIQDAPITARPQIVGGKASAAAPGDVSADNDAQAFWCLRNGSQVNNLAYGGNLLGATEDAAAAADPSGYPLIARRRDTPTSAEVTTDGDYIALITDSSARLRTVSQGLALSANSALPAPTADTGAVGLRADRYGRQLVDHVDAGLVTFKAASYTATQTGAAIWTPASGKRICLLAMHVSTDPVATPALVTIWMGASADTTYTEGTDQLIWQGHLMPTTAVTQQITREFALGHKMITTDHVLRITTSDAIDVRVGFYGYEFTP